MADFVRQVAKYMFTNELKNSVVPHIVNKDDEQFASTHVISPTGQELSRVFVCGTLTEVEDIGADTSYYRARLVDQTGAIAVYAGEYQPEAVAAIEDVEIPAYVGVVGKINLFETPDKTIIPSIRAESVFVIDEDTIRTWSFMAARNLITYIDDPTIEVEPKALAEAHYGDQNAEYKEMAIKALEYLLNGE